MRGICRVFFVSPCAIVLLAAAVAAAFAPSARAAWDPDGLPVCTAANSQNDLVAVSDELGGMLMIWTDARDGGSKIYTQRVDGAGRLLWTIDGVYVGGSPSVHPWICADGSGGAWVVYTTEEWGALHARHVSAAGAAGSIIELAGGNIYSYNSRAVCVSDGAAGAIVAWVQEVDPPSGDLQVIAQRVSAAGTKLWGTQGVLVSTDIVEGGEVSLAPDIGNHGAFVGWVLGANQGYAQRLTAAGALCWNVPTGRFVATVTAGSPVRVADRGRASGGCHVMYKWHHYGSPSIFDYDALSVQEMDSSSTVFWTTTFASGGGESGEPGLGDGFIVLDKAGGTGCVWDRIEGGIGKGVFCQSLDWDGSEEWNGGNPLQVSVNLDGNHLPSAAVRTGYWGLSIAWVDDSGADPLLRCATAEQTMGVIIGRGVVAGGNSGTTPCVVFDPNTSVTNALVSWVDERPGGGVTDIYASGFTSSGWPVHPNLMATRLTPGEPFGMAGGDPVSFFVKVENQGSCDADSFWTTIFPDQATAPNVGDVPPASVHSVHCGPLARWDSVIVEVVVDAPPSAESWTMWGFADYTDDVEEFTDEDDNVVGPVPYEWIGHINLEIANVTLSDPEPFPWQFVNATVTVKNTGTEPAYNVWVDYFLDQSTAPPPGAHGTQRNNYFTIPAGDSVSWSTSPTTATEFVRLTSWFRVDTDDLVDESNENDNLSGPHYTDFQVPPEDGWPRTGGARFHSSPAIAELDGDPTDLEVVIGCDDGKVYAWRADGTPVPGWPVTLPDSVVSSPAVGDIYGDCRSEVVVGCDDGRLYAISSTGTVMWDYLTADPIRTTPALADFNGDGKLEIAFTSGGLLYLLQGNGYLYSGSWPYFTGGVLSSPAVGDVDGAAGLEIAVIAHGFLKPVQSRAYLFRPNATVVSGFPASVDTIVVADPVLGNVVDPSGDLEIVSGGLDGKVYVWNKSGALWLTVPRVPGTIESSPALGSFDADANLEIAVTSRRYIGTFPPYWEGLATLVDHTGTIVAKWPKQAGTWRTGTDPVPAPVVTGSSPTVMAGGPSVELAAWDRSGLPMYAFPLAAGGAIYGSAALGNLDGDGWLELVIAGGDSVRMWELCSSSYPVNDLWWPMFRHDRARTGCYGFEIPTDAGDVEETPPAVSAIRSIYPNPFNPATRIAFDVSAAGRVTLSIYDVSGRRVAVLVDRDLAPGRYEGVWNGATAGGVAASSGLYFCRFEAGRVVETRKLVLVR